MHLERAILRRPLTASALQLTLGAIALLMLTERAAFAAVDDEPATATVSPAEPVAGPIKDDATELRRKELTIGLYLLFGIITMGGGMLLWIVWWGFRIRRRLLQPLPPAPRGDELWFLKRPIENSPSTRTTNRKLESPDDPMHPDRDQDKE